MWRVGSVIAAPKLSSAGPVVVAHGRSCFMSYGIFSDQGLNLCSNEYPAEPKKTKTKNYSGKGRMK